MALMLAMPDELILQADLASKGNTNWPKGKACLIVKYLMEKFCQAGAMTTFKVQTQINTVTMGKRNNPVVVIEGLEQIEANFSF